MGWAVVGSSEAAEQGSREPALLTVHDWLEREHASLRRYLAIVRQAAHDYAYGYKTPTLLLPCLVDLYAGRISAAHAVERRVVHPVLRAELPAELQQILRLVEHDQESEAHTITLLQQRIEHSLPPERSEEVARLCDDLAQTLNRHIVFYEERFYPVIEALSPPQQQQMLRDIARGERALFDPDDRKRWEDLLAYIEAQIDQVAGRIW